MSAVTAAGFPHRSQSEFEAIVSFTGKQYSIFNDIQYLTAYKTQWTYKTSPTVHLYLPGDIAINQHDS